MNNRDLSAKLIEYADRTASPSLEVLLREAAWRLAVPRVVLLYGDPAACEECQAAVDALGQGINVLIMPNASAEQRNVTRKYCGEVWKCTKNKSSSSITIKLTGGIEAVVKSESFTTCIGPLIENLIARRAEQ